MCVGQKKEAWLPRGVRHQVSVIANQPAFQAGQSPEQDYQGDNVL